MEEDKGRERRNRLKESDGIRVGRGSNGEEVKEMAIKEER